MHARLHAAAAAIHSELIIKSCKSNEAAPDDRPKVYCRSQPQSWSSHEMMKRGPERNGICTIGLYKQQHPFVKASCCNRLGRTWSAWRLNERRISDAMLLLHVLPICVL